MANCSIPNFKLGGQIFFDLSSFISVPPYLNIEQNSFEQLFGFCPTDPRSNDCSAFGHIQAEFHQDLPVFTISFPAIKLIYSLLKLINNFQLFGNSYFILVYASLQKVQFLLTLHLRFYFYFFYSEAMFTLLRCFFWRPLFAHMTLQLFWQRWQIRNRRSISSHHPQFRPFEFLFLQSYRNMLGRPLERIQALRLL